MGDVIHSGPDIAGDAVNVASRIEPLALPGGVCISAAVHAAVINKIPETFETIGSPPLKNVASPLEIFRLSGYGQRASPGAASPHNRVAILPFLNISADPSDEFFADGMT